MTVRPSPRVVIPSRLAILVLIAAAACGAPDAAEPRIRGFGPEGSARQARVERALRERVSPDRIREHLEWLTSRAHTAGTDNARRTAEYVRDRLREYGWDADLREYTAWLTLPVETSIELLEPEARVIPTTEAPVPGDPFADEEAVRRFPAWNGYSASGDVTAPLVYANFGTDADFRRLRELGVDPEGKVALIRYFEAGTGRKIHNAQRYGALGVILYADPEQDGFVLGDVYPQGDWRPPGGIMRRSVELEPYSGDPLSPGFASVAGAERLAPDAVHLPRIPVVPTSYGAVEQLMGDMGGPVAPEDWQGGLPVPYRLGGAARVRVRAVMDAADRSMVNVVARLEGQRFPYEWVTFGNHHDAWIYGAGDPSSGTATLLEWARVVGELAGEGLRPQRTLVIGVWDAEEMLLGGSTEWVEEHTDELLEHAVANINMDSAVFNTDRPLHVSAHASLQDLFREVAATVSLPGHEESFDQTWVRMQRQTFPLGSVDGFGYFYEPGQPLTEPRVFEVPGDDAAPFTDYLALPASDMYYGGDYGMYHSVYENFHWMSTVVDPDFEHHALMARLQAIVGLRLANADLLPLEFATEANFWRRAYEDLEADAAGRGQSVPRLQEALELIDGWEREAVALEADRRTLLAAGAPDGDGLQELNRRVGRMFRDFYRADGSPGRPWNKNLFVGSAYDLETASGSLLPGIRFALDEDDLELADSESRVYLQALRTRVENLKALRAAVTPGGP